MSWLAGQVPSIDAIFMEIFDPEWTHIAVHLMLYSVLAGLLSYLFQNKVRLRIFIPAIVILVGILQETMQIITLDRTPGWAEIFDLGTDLVGALIGCLLFWGISKLVKRSKSGRLAAKEMNQDEE